jgi:hypothetical protein
MICFLPVTVEPFQFSPAEPVAYELQKADDRGQKKKRKVGMRKSEKLTAAGN